MNLPTCRLCPGGLTCVSMLSMLVAMSAVSLSVVSAIPLRVPLRPENSLDTMQQQYMWCMCRAANGWSPVQEVSVGLVTLSCLPDTHTHLQYTHSVNSCHIYMYVRCGGAHQCQVSTKLFLLVPHSPLQ